MRLIAAVVSSLTVMVVIAIGASPIVLAAESPVSARQVETPAPSTFEELVAGSGLSYTRPAGFQETPVVVNGLWSYEHAVLKTDSNVEIRYAVRPIERMEIAYDDPHSNAPDPNHIFPMMFQTLIGLLSDGRHTPSREYPPDQARSKFNANWAAAALFDVDPRFTEQFKLALMIAMHKNNLADAYAIYLFNDYEQAKPVINATMDSLKFLP